MNWISLSMVALLSACAPPLAPPPTESMSISEVRILENNESISADYTLTNNSSQLVCAIGNKVFRDDFFSRLVPYGVDGNRIESIWDGGFIPPGPQSGISISIYAIPPGGSLDETVSIQKQFLSESPSEFILTMSVGNCPTSEESGLITSIEDLENFKSSATTISSAPIRYTSGP